MNRSTSQRSPLSPTLWPNGFRPKRTWALVAFLLLAFVLGQVLDAIVVVVDLVRHGVAVADIKQHITLSWALVIGQLLSYVPLLAVEFPLLPWAAGRSWRDLGLRLPNARAILYGLGGAFAMYVATIGIAAAQFAITHKQPAEAAIDIFKSSTNQPLLIAFGVIAAVIAPFVEELLFRGFLFNVMLRFMPVAVAAIVSGLIFGAAHLSPTALAPLAAGGVVLAYTYYLSGSLTASMIAHAVFNLINTIAIVVFHQS